MGSPLEADFMRAHNRLTDAEEGFENQLEGGAQEESHSDSMVPFLGAGPVWHNSYLVAAPTTRHSVINSC